MLRFALSLFAAGPAGLAVLLLLALLAMPADEARADSGHPGGNFPLHQAAGEDGDLAAVIHLLGSAHAIDVNESPSGPPYYGHTPLHQAVAWSQATIAATLIAAGADVNAKDDGGYTPLHNSIFVEDTAIISLLIAAGADVNTAKHRGFPRGTTPLHDSIFVEDTAVISLLIAAGADVNAKDETGRTPLNRAAYWQRVSVMPVLLSAGADVNTKNNNGRTPLHEAASEDNVLAISLLLSAGADVNARENYGGTPLLQADDLTAISLLLSAGADVNAENDGGITRLHGAAGDLDVSVVLLLLSAGADANGNAESGADTPLHWAANSRHPNAEDFIESVISLLLSAGADVNAKNDLNRTVLLVTFRKGHLEGIPVLVLAGGHWGEACADSLTVNPAGPSPPCIAPSAKVCEELTPPHFYSVPRGVCLAYPGGDYPLHHAAGQGGNLTAVVQLLRLGDERGFDVNAKNNFGSTPLHYAAGWGRATIVATLLLAGADVNAKNNNDETPLHHAVLGAPAPVVSLLLLAGADVNAKNEIHSAPLHWAAGYGDASVVSLLLSADAEVNAKNILSVTPLHFAAGEGRALNAWLLLLAGADVNAKDFLGRTPLREATGHFCTGDQAGCAAVRPVLIAAGGHWGEACAGAAVVNPAGPAVPCLCESPNVGAADNCQAPSADACGGLTPAKFYSAEKSACVPYAPCVGGTLNPETNACECPDRLAALGDGVCEYKAATCEMLGGVVEDERVCSGIDINDTFCIVDSASAFPCLGLFYHVWLCNDRFNRPALDPWHCGKICSDGLRARGAKCAAD